MINLVFFGEDIFSLEVLRALIDSSLCIRTRAIVILEPVTVSGKRLVEFASRYGIPLIIVKSVKEQSVKSEILRLKADLIVAAHFQRILPAELYSSATMGAFNLHPSLLPKYKGMSPQHWPIVFGDSFTGVTVHRMADAVDTGRIMRQVAVPLEPDIYIADLQKKFLGIYGQVMVDALRLASDGFKGKEQFSEGTSYFHRIREDDMRITVEMRADHAYGMIRAFSLPYAGAWIDNLRLIRAKPLLYDEFDYLVRRDPVRGIKSRDNRLYLVLNDGALEITKWKKK